MPDESKQSVRVYFEVLHRFRERLKQLGADPDENLKTFGNSPLGDLITDTDVQFNLEGFFGDLGGAVPMPFPGPDTTAIEFVDICFPPKIRRRLNVLFYDVAVVHTPALGNISPTQILNKSIDEVFPTEAAQNDLRGAVDETVEASFRDGNDPAQLGRTVAEAIEEVMA